jgi:hypothetical protein
MRNFICSLSSLLVTIWPFDLYVLHLFCTHSYCGADVPWMGSYNEANICTMIAQGHLHQPSGRVLVVSPTDNKKFNLNQIKNLVNVLKNEHLLFCCVREQCVIVNTVAREIGMHLNIDATVRLNREGIYTMVYGDVLIINNEFIKIQNDLNPSKKAAVSDVRASKALRNSVAKKEANKKPRLQTVLGRKKNNLLQ